MSDTLTLSGRIKVANSPASMDASFNLTLLGDLFEQMAIKLHHESEYDLVVDGAQAVSLGGIASAAVVVLKPDQKITVLLTSADGTAQAVPCDQLMVIMCGTTPFTAISIVRQAGIETNVRVALAQLAP